MTASAAATERALTFDCKGDTLVGVLHQPAAPAHFGVVVIVGGPQYRVGSHRQFVLLARTLADAGFAVLRFDVRGMGDSTGSARGFESLHDNLQASIDAMHFRVPELSGVALWGLCDAASAALLYMHGVGDPRVTGLCLLNPWVRTPTGQARTQLRHYYWRRILEPSFWSKMLSGGLSARALTELLRNLRQARRTSQDVAHPTRDALYTHRMAEAFGRFPGPLLLLLSGNDYTAKEFLEYTRTDAAWRRALEHSAVQRHDLPQADHTFSNEEDWREVERLTLAWLHAGSSALRAERGERAARSTPRATGASP